MYAVLNPDGTFYELRDGSIDATTNTRNRQKRYAVPYRMVQPTLQVGEQHVLDRRDVTSNQMTDTFRAIKVPPPPIAVERQLNATIRVLLNKGLLTREEIDAAL